MALLEPSTIPVPLAFRSRCRLPVPAILFTVTVYAAPEPHTEPLTPLADPLLVTAQSPSSPPLTASEKFTAKTTVVAVVFCVVGEERNMLTTDGGVKSA